MKWRLRSSGRVGSGRIDFRVLGSSVAISRPESLSSSYVMIYTVIFFQLILVSCMTDISYKYIYIYTHTREAYRRNFIKQTRFYIAHHRRGMERTRSETTPRLVTLIKLPPESSCISQCSTEGFSFDETSIGRQLAIRGAVFGWSCLERSLSSRSFEAVIEFTESNLVRIKDVYWFELSLPNGGLCGQVARPRVVLF